MHHRTGAALGDIQFPMHRKAVNDRGEHLCMIQDPDLANHYVTREPRLQRQLSPAADFRQYYWRIEQAHRISAVEHAKNERR